MDYGRNPSELQEALLDSVLAGVGCTDRRNDVASSSSSTSSVDTNDENRSNNYKRVQYVAYIGGRIMTAAQQLAAQNQADVVEAVRAELPHDVRSEQLLDVLNQNEDYQLWTTAIEQLDTTTSCSGGGGAKNPWTYMLIDSTLPNAFVTEILPRHVFITTSMLDLMSNDDELALVLGHELSHMILGHISEKNMLETILRTIEVLLLSMDPTTGLLSLAVVGALATLRTALTAAHSRDHEYQADAMGIQLAAMACFDTRRAADVFRRMHEQHIGLALPNQQGQQRRRLLSFADTHPPSDERYQKLILASTTENVEKYSDTTCASIGRQLRSIMGPSVWSTNSNDGSSSNDKKT